MVKVQSPDLDFIERLKGHLDALRVGLREAIKPSRLTVQYPRERRKLPDNFRGMLILDVDGCISCFQCAFICPANAIVMKRAPDGKLYPCVNYAKCIFCHFCVETCTKGAWRSTKIMDVAFNDEEGMLLTTGKLIKPPKLLREEEKTVSYELKNGELILVKSDELDELVPKKKSEKRATMPKKPPKTMKDVKYFGNLKAEVIDKKICSRCLTCVASCPVKGITNQLEFPDWEEKCRDCGFCVIACPRWNYSPLSGIGKYIEILAAKSNRFQGQDGGMVTEILASAMEMGIIDSAIVVGRNENWEPVVLHAKSVEDLEKAAGTKYSFADVMPELRKVKGKVAIVGTPCMVSGARNLQKLPKYRDKIKLIVGLFCMENFYYDQLAEALKSKGVDDLTKVEKMDIKKGKFIVKMGEEKISFGVKELDGIVPSGCKVCQDFVAVESDVSVGSVGSPNGFSSVIVRTDVAKKIVDYIKEKGYAEFSEANVEVIKKLINYKKKIHPYG